MTSGGVEGNHMYCPGIDNEYRGRKRSHEER